MWQTQRSPPTPAVQSHFVVPASFSRVRARLGDVGARSGAIGHHRRAGRPPPYRSTCRRSGRRRPARGAAAAFYCTVPLLDVVAPLEEDVVSGPSSPAPLEVVAPDELVVIPELVVVAPLAFPDEPPPDEVVVPPSFSELLPLGEVPPPQPAPTSVVRTNAPARPPTARRTRNSLFAISNSSGSKVRCSLGCSRR